MPILVRPAAGLTVLDPDGLPLPAEGAFVKPDAFWQRRIAKGEVNIAGTGEAAAGSRAITEVEE